MVTKPATSASPLPASVSHALASCLPLLEMEMEPLSVLSTAQPHVVSLAVQLKPRWGVAEAIACSAIDTSTMLSGIVPSSLTNDSAAQLNDIIVVIAEGPIVCEHPRVMDRSHDRP
ncbi:hypothetical protein D0Y60_22040 [Shinella sp. WSJ-2]|nr:hypothetical protein D0Y60_22040 [Shinella sp. WSJ-2]